jgi:hypothetical protein
LKKRSTIVFAPQFKTLEHEVLKTIENFDEFGTILQQERNTIRRGNVGDEDITIKSFREPLWIQALIYGLFRPSKARRSFLYAEELEKRGIGTATPIAYVEHYNGPLLKSSYFVSRYIEHDFTIREVLNDKISPKDVVMQAFVEFTLKLHNNEVNHLDHSPGNTLIRKVEDEYQFSIIDINRMKFEKMDLRACMKNFVRLSRNWGDLGFFARSYAALTGNDVSVCESLMRSLMLARTKKVERKKRLKKMLKK